MQQALRMIATCSNRPTAYVDFGLDRFLDEVKGYGYVIELKKGSRKHPKLINLVYKSHLKGVIKSLMVDIKRGLIIWESPLSKGELVATTDYYTAYRELLNMLT